MYSKASDTVTTRFGEKSLGDVIGWAIVLGVTFGFLGGVAFMLLTGWLN